MSSKQYICELCKKEFKQKSDFQKHSNKKSPCISLDEIKKMTQKIENKTDDLSKLTTIFKYCLNVLRDKETLTGDKALRTLAHLIDLKLVEPQLGKTIDIDNFSYDLSGYGFTSEEEQKYKKDLLFIARFSNLSKQDANNIPNNMKCLWKDILSVHPKTKNIFLVGRGFDITHQSTYMKLITKLMTIDFNSIEHDILGEAYEQVIKDVMTGKILGQFFTPPKVKKMMVQLINPQVKADGTIETIFDPAMGTGGFLINCLRHLILQSKTKNIELDWNFVRNFGLGGREAEPDTYQLAVSNMLISSGQIFDVLEKGDSIRDPITKKYDIIIANPPFGIDGLDYSDIEHKLRDEYLPIKSNSAVPLFLQAIIYMLRIGGRCAIVLPEGQELFSKNKALVSVREFLMKTCDLKEVIYLPAGTFTHTSIKTCIFYFIKKCNGNDVLTTNIKKSKVTKKEMSREYELTKIHQTNKVSFYDYNPETDVKHLLLDVPIEELSQNNYSLNYTEYLKDDDEDKKYNNDIILKKLGDVCCIIKGDKKRSKEGKNDGLYPLYYCSILGNLYLDTYDYIGEGIIINKTNGSGKAMVYYGNNKYNVGETTLHFKSNNNEVQTKYIYYYLLYNIELIEAYFKGANQKSIVEDDLFKIKIPIPSFEKQQDIVKYLDFIYDKVNKTSNNKIYELKKLNEFCLNNQKIFGENMNTKLGDVCCIIKGDKKRSKDGKDEGLYPLYYCSILGNLYLDTYDYVGEGIIINKTNGSGKAMVYYGNNKYNVGETTLHFKSNNNEAQTKYIYYYLLHNIELIEAYFKGANQKSIVEDDLFKINIPIPSLEKQKEIVEYCEYNDNLIKHLEKEIEMNKNLAKQFITSIVKSNDNDKYESDSEDEDSDEEYNIIKYKDVDYIVENEQLYKINDDNTKGELFGTYKNNKVKKTK